MELRLLWGTGLPPTMEWWIEDAMAECKGLVTNVRRDDGTFHSSHCFEDYVPISCSVHSSTHIQPLFQAFTAP